MISTTTWPSTPMPQVLRTIKCAQLQLGWRPELHEAKLRPLIGIIRQNSGPNRAIFWVPKAPNPTVKLTFAAPSTGRTPTSGWRWEGRGPLRRSIFQGHGRPRLKTRAVPALRLTLRELQKSLGNLWMAVEDGSRE
jgi:hypothetical protein